MHYMKKGGNSISRLNFEKNLEEKLHDPDFLADIDFLLSSEIKKKRSSSLGGAVSLGDGSQLTSKGWNVRGAAREVNRKVINALSGGMINRISNSSRHGY